MKHAIVTAVCLNFKPYKLLTLYPFLLPTLFLMTQIASTRLHISHSRLTLNLLCWDYRSRVRHCTWSRSTEAQTQALCELRRTLPQPSHTQVPLVWKRSRFLLASWYLQVPRTVFMVIFPFCSLKPFVLKTVFAHAFFCPSGSAVKVPIQVLYSSVPVSSWFSIVSVSLLLFSFNSYTFHCLLFLVASLQRHLCCYCWDFGIWKSAILNSPPHPCGLVLYQQSFWSPVN